MQDLIRERLDDSVPAGKDHYRVISSMECVADSDGAVLPEVYQPCKGTWTEFKGDIKRFFSNLKAEYVERIENIRETLRKVFHRKDNQQLHGR